MSAVPPFLFELAGVECDPPENWRDIKLKMYFQQDSAQADIDIDSFILVNEANQLCLDHRDAGRMTEGVPFRLTFQDPHATTSIVKTGYLNLMDSWQIISPVMCKAKVVFHGTANHINTRIEGLTFELLRQRGRFPNKTDYAAVPYLVIEEFDGAKFAALEITLLLTGLEIAKLVKELTNELLQMIALITGGFPGTGQVAAVIAALGQLLLNVAYGAILLNAFKDLGFKFIDKIYPATKTAYGLYYRRALTAMFTELGYTFQSPISDLDTHCYLPSKPPDSDRKNNGIPNPQDPGYGCGDMLDICQKKFNAKLKIDENAKTVWLLSENDPLWLQGNPYVMPDILREGKEYNTDDAINTLIISYVGDASDYWTQKEYKGRSYERTTSPITTGTADNITVKGLTEIRIPLALGARKADLTELEAKLLFVAQQIDGLVNQYGQNILSFGARMNQQGPGANTGVSQQILKHFLAGNLASLVLNRTNMLKVGSDFWEVPKDIYLVNGFIPADHRDHLSAKACYDNYYSFRSLVANNFAGQKALYKDQVIPFTQENFLQVGGNKYFQLANGKTGEFLGVLEWAFGEDTATASWAEQETWCPNFKETFTEAA